MPMEPPTVSSTTGAVASWKRTNQTSKIATATSASASSTGEHSHSVALRAVDHGSTGGGPSRRSSSAAGGAPALAAIRGEKKWCTSARKGGERADTEMGFGSGSGGRGGETARKISWAEVKKHNTSTDGWIVHQGKVRLRQR